MHVSPGHERNCDRLYSGTLFIMLLLIVLSVSCHQPVVHGKVIDRRCCFLVRSYGWPLISRSECGGLQSGVGK
eukprot:56617-Eustigmatos_ZCMA.PRE.1